jgi:hypothetical protein
VISDPTTLSIAALPPRVDTCELCATTQEPLRVAVTIRHTRGSTVSFAACDRCSAAIRRVIAAAGSASAGGPAYLRLVTEDEVVPVMLTPGETAPDTVGVPVLIHEFAEGFRDDAGVDYVVRVYGQGRADSTWIGWLTFVGRNAETIKRTPRETSQSSREHLAYWASGLQPSYIQGAFQRAA